MFDQMIGDMITTGMANESQQTLWKENYVRDRGIFSDTDRRFLFGIKEYESETGYFDRRRAIKTRLRNGIPDLAFFSLVDERDRERLINELPSDELADGTQGLIEFLLEYHDEDMRKLSKLLERAILGAINRDLEKIRYGGGVLNVDVTIDVKQDYDSEEIYERFKETGGSDLTPAEVGVLVRDGKIGTEEMEALRVENTS